jgi:hypothetical protein
MLSVGLDHVQEHSSDALARIVIIIWYTVASRLDLLSDKSAIARGSLAVVSLNRESTEAEANLFLNFPLEAFRFSSAMSILQYCIPSHSN